MKILITGGTVFVSRYAAEVFARKHDVFVLNRNTRPQVEGVTLIEADRHALGERLKSLHFSMNEISYYISTFSQQFLQKMEVKY